MSITERKGGNKFFHEILRAGPEKFKCVSSINPKDCNYDSCGIDAGVRKIEYMFLRSFPHLNVGIIKSFNS